MRDEATVDVGHCSARDVAIERPERIVWHTKWLDGPLAEAPEARVTLEFSAINGGTRLKRRHEFFPDRQARDHHGQGWGSGLERLAKWLAGELASDREVVISRVFDAPRELAWNALVDPEHVVHWWGPRGFTTTIHEMQGKPGGVWRHTMHGPNGVDYPNKGVLVEVVRPARLVYSHDGGKKGGPAAHFQATWTFEAQDDKTKLTMRMLFDSAAERDQVVQEYGAVEGGRRTLERLAKYLPKVESPA